MKNILLNKKWMCIIALLLLVISLSSCSGDIEEFGIVWEFTDGFLLTLLWVYGMWIIVISIFMPFFRLGPPDDVHYFNLDGKWHYYTTPAKGGEPSSWGEILNDLLLYYVIPLPFFLGCVSQVCVLSLTGKINIWIEIILFFICQYVMFQLCKRCPTLVRIISWLILIAVVGAVMYILVSIVNAFN